MGQTTRPPRPPSTPGAETDQADPPHGLGPLATALAAAQHELQDRAPTPGADFAGVQRVVGPVLSRHGLAVTQSIELAGDGVVICTRLLHEGGGSFVGRYPIGGSGPLRERSDALALARRISLEAMVGVCTAEPDSPAEAPPAEAPPAADRPPAKTPPRERPHRSPGWEVITWASALDRLELTLDDVLWWTRHRSESGRIPSEMAPDERDSLLRWIVAGGGAARLHADLDELREELQRAFFARWSALFPIPRKRDGATDAEVASATATSERYRRAVMRAWYGVESIKRVPVRAALQGERSMRWLRTASALELEAAVRQVLGTRRRSG